MTSRGGAFARPLELDEIVMALEAFYETVERPELAQFMSHMWYSLLCYVVSERSCTIHMSVPCPQTPQALEP